MMPIPRLLGDRTLALYRDPYGFIPSTCRKLSSDVFKTRIMGHPTYCMTGRDAAGFVYDEENFQRSGAMPSRIQRTLLGEGGVQGLDGAAHRHRKAMFLEALDDQHVAGLLQDTARDWFRQAQHWVHRGRVSLYAEAKVVLGRCVCAWVGLPLGPEADERIRDLALLYEGAGEIGLGHRRARKARQRLEAWLAAEVEKVRSNPEAVREGAALRLVADHRDLDGRPLPARVAAVELLNVLRPTVAVAVFVVHVAHALSAHPEHVPRLRDDPSFAWPFVQEVRRSYPFFPAIAAKARRDCAWQGHQFKAGTRVLFDVYGTNRDPRLWPRAEEFMPERFVDVHPDPFGFMPQGGGDRRSGHRCAGEPLTVALMLQAVRFLVQLDYRVPDQDQSLRGVPPLPAEGFVIDQVRPLRRLVQPLSP